jgi:sugar/nucleoside kinase (ribokinase family)
MQATGMDVRFVEAVPGRPTLLSVCFQYPDGSGGNVTTVDSAASALTETDVDRAREWLSSRAIALAAPEAPLGARRRLLERARETGALGAASLTTAEVAEARDTGLLSLVDLLALNEDEAAALAGEPWPAGDPGRFLERCAVVLRASQPDIRFVVTAGPQGAYGWDASAWTHVPALSVPVASTAGAGDALLGALLAGLAAGLPFASTARGGLDERPLESALDLGALAAAFKVTSPHTIPPGLTLDALVAFGRTQGVRLGRRLAGLVPADLATED